MTIVLLLNRPSRKRKHKKLLTHKPGAPRSKELRTMPGIIAETYRKAQNYDDFFDIRNAHIGIDYAFDMRYCVDRRIEKWL